MTSANKKYNKRKGGRHDSKAKRPIGNTFFIHISAVCQIEHMKKNPALRTAVILLTALSALIYLLQILIFHDPSTTFFYIFQDMAFLPFSVAIATLVIGAILAERDKKHRISATRMIRSSFFTSIGASILAKMYTGVQNPETIQQYLSIPTEGSEKEQLAMIERNREFILKAPVVFKISEEIYENVRKIVNTHTDDMMIFSSNSALLDAEYFTNMLAGLLHLRDEFRLRGAWEDLTQADREHMQEDFQRVFLLLSANGLENTWYLKNTYPDFYGTATGKLQERNR